MTLFRHEADENYEALVAENSFISDLQIAIEEALVASGVTQSELANRLGVSEARISKILSGNGTNLQTRTIARIAYALGMRALVEFAENEQATPKASESFTDWVRRACETLEQGRAWEQVEVPNDNWGSIDAFALENGRHDILDAVAA
ncbi:MAG: helix-turn-helix transcriptional regulator [Caulobacteraceae bacterium]